MCGNSVSVAINSKVDLSQVPQQQKNRQYLYWIKNNHLSAEKFEYQRPYILTRIFTTKSFLENFTHVCKICTEQYLKSPSNVPQGLKICSKCQGSSVNKFEYQSNQLKCNICEQTEIGTKYTTQKVIMSWRICQKCKGSGLTNQLNYIQSNNYKNQPVNLKYPYVQ